MKSKKIISLIVASAITAGACGVALTGCISTFNEENLKQVVARVDITKSANFDDADFGDCAAAITEDVFYKRDMITSFINGYYTMVQQGSSYEQTFEAIKDSLVSNAVVKQYATAYLLKEKISDPDSGVTLESFKAKTTEKEKYEYLLDKKSVDEARYSLYTSLNNSLDGIERNIIKNTDEEYKGSGTRSTPAGIDTLKEDYPIPEDYGVYTGYKGYLLADAGEEYEPLTGTDMNTRRKAYASFVGNLKSNYLISQEDKQTTDILELEYVKDSYISQLEQGVINEFSELFEKKQEEIISTPVDGVYTYVKDKYEGVEDGLLTAQEKSYSSNSAFESAMSSMSDTSFILYSPATNGDNQPDANGTYRTYGYVYNILLPFSQTQSVLLKSLKSYLDDGLIDDSQYFYERNNLLKGITTTDQRADWFNGEKDYSFDASKYNDAAVVENRDYFQGTINERKADRKYLFFENNLKQTEKYEPLAKYDGRYTYNGKVVENEDGSYKLVPYKLDIDGMLAEFKAYIDYVLGGNKTEIHGGDVMTGTWNGTNKAYYGIESYTKKDNAKEIDYSKLVYATGKVNFEAAGKSDMFVTSTERYKAMAAVNELQYAYTTDTGVLSQYIGYSVSAYETSYIKEFEYAAQQALRMGAGAFKVCAGDYGWHLIYVTDTFSTEGGEVYEPVWNVDRVTTQGTFENRFYEWYKDSVLTNEASIKREEILKLFNNDEAVTVYKDAYKDLSRLG